MKMSRSLNAKLVTHENKVDIVYLVVLTLSICLGMWVLQAFQMPLPYEMNPALVPFSVRSLKPDTHIYINLAEVAPFFVMSVLAVKIRRNGLSPRLLVLLLTFSGLCIIRLVDFAVKIYSVIH